MRFETWPSLREDVESSLLLDKIFYLEKTDIIHIINPHPSLILWIETEKIKLF